MNAGKDVRKTMNAVSGSLRSYAQMYHLDEEKIVISPATSKKKGRSRPDHSGTHTRGSIVKMAAQVVADKDQWEKLQAAMRERNLKTGMSLHQSIGILLTERFEEIEKNAPPKPKIPTSRRLSSAFVVPKDFALSLKSEATAMMPRRQSKVPAMMLATLKDENDGAEFPRPSKTLLSMLEHAMQVTEEEAPADVRGARTA